MFSSQTFRSVLRPSCLHIIGLVAITYIPFRGWKNAADAPILQTAWIISFVTCIMINHFVYNHLCQPHKLIGLVVIVIGHCLGVVSDHEAEFFFLEIVLAFVYGLCHGIMLPMIKDRMDTVVKVTMSDLVINVY